ncbi:TIGR04338 family metallohydrolase [Mycobacterium sp. NPDC006124]|uniref:TIGR04338 family metallohydrolase n=1 Tax=Mycobacterium sp. NPDC006124 TaxID=3156729 RepID=UPI0033A60073
MTSHFTATRFPWSRRQICRAEGDRRRDACSLHRSETLGRSTRRPTRERAVGHNRRAFRPKASEVSASAVYGAEHQWSAVLDRGGQVDFHGSLIDVPMQRRFADIPSMQRYVDEVLALDSVRENYPNAGPVRVRERRGQSKAHYEPSTQTVAIPLRNIDFGRESTLLHELAHHLSVSQGLPATSSGTRWHGVEFRRAMTFLVSVVLGEPAALLLRGGYHASGLRRSG